MLALCKCQKWKEHVKVSKCRKFGDLILKTVALLRFLKTIEYPEILKENVWKFAWNPGWEGNSHALPTRNSDTFFVKFSVFKNFTSAKVFNIFIPKFSALTNFHLLLQSANIMFSIVPRNVKKVC